MSNISKQIKVAKVLNNSNLLVINAGYEDGIRDGMVFIVYSVGDEIIDPDTGKSLGDLEISKGKYKIKHIQDQMTMIESSNPRSPFLDAAKLTNVFSKFDLDNSLRDTIAVGDYVKVINKL